MIRKVTFYWLVATLVLVDSWLLSKPNILGKIGLIIYKYHYLRSFPRTLLTVWIVVSTGILIVWVVQRLLDSGKLSRTLSMWILAACFAAAALIMVKVAIDFTAWTYSHSGSKFKYGAHLLPGILMLVFGNALLSSWMTPKLQPMSSTAEAEGKPSPGAYMTTISRDTSQPSQPESFSSR